MQGVETIAAIATPSGVGGIGVVRVSGPAAAAIIPRMFLRPDGTPLREPESHRLYYGCVIDPGGERVDEAMLCFMRQPRSYTREDVVEISCHGGLIVTQRVLDTVVAQGARVAEPGEFTKRAFVNGRLDLAQAEAVIDLINARTLASHRAALHQLDGALSRYVRAIREELVQVSVYLEAGIDFPEEEIELVATGSLVARLEGVAAQLDQLLGTFERGRVVHEGVATAIVGRPNVGKSSLLNALLGRDRAIVSPQPGTTRDTIEAALDLDGLLLRLIDTAGIRSAADAIEQEGVRRAREVATRAELLVVILDGSTALTPDDHALLAETASRPRVLVRNKSDLPMCWAWQELGLRESEALPVAISALHGDGLATLQETIVRQALGHEALHHEEVLLTQARHRQSVATALHHVQTAARGLYQGIPLECVAFDVTEALQQIAEILGESYTDEVLDRIFSRFCIGK
jgi:tRNA modification GTPase